MKTNTPFKDSYIKQIPWLVALGAIVALGVSGCETTKAVYKAATTGVNLSASGQTGVVDDDTIVVRAEQLQTVGLDTFNLFLKLDYDNKELFKQIRAHQYAEWLRQKNEHGKQRAKQWIDSLKFATRAYKNNRTSLNHANLNTAIKTVQEAITQSKQYINKSGVNP